MLVLALQIYNENPTVQCYSQHTTGTITSSGTKTVIQIDLVPVEGVYCDFPPGVMLQLKFQEEDLNTAEIYVDFDFNTTKRLEIEVDP